MQREILFRGRPTKADHENFVFGGFVKDCMGRCFIIDQIDYIFTPIEVDPKTVGQYTGLKDKNGVRIFEGDNLLIDGWDCGEVTVVFNRGAFCFEVEGNEHLHDCKYLEKGVIVGNINDK